MEIACIIVVVIVADVLLDLVILRLLSRKYLVAGDLLAVLRTNVRG